MKGATPMKKHRRIRVLVLTLALGLGVWGAALTYTTASFSDGDVLSAAALNTLLNDNFDAVGAELATKFDKAGGAIEGSMLVAAETEVFGGLGALTVKQEGTGPALSVKAEGSGILIGAANASGTRFVVENDGSIKIGALGGSPLTASGSVRIDATEGTVTNDVGSGLPLAFGRVSSACNVVASVSTENVVASAVNSGGFGMVCVIEIDGESANSYVLNVTPHGALEVLTPVLGSNGPSETFVTFVDTDDSFSRHDFTFVAYKKGSN